MSDVTTIAAAVIGSAVESLWNQIRNNPGHSVRPTVLFCYSHVDREIAKQIEVDLAEPSLKITDSDDIRIGEDWHKGIDSLIRSADIYVILLTEESINSGWLAKQLELIEIQINDRDDKLIIPVVSKADTAPTFIRSRNFIPFQKDDLKSIASSIRIAIQVFVNDLILRNENINSVREHIKLSAADYIEKSLASLSRREKSEKRIAYSWQLLGFLFLIGGVYGSIYFFREIELVSLQNKLGVLEYTIMSLKSLVVLAIVIVAVRYAFDLSKAHMNEALKNADRAHAISFGEFYLRAFEERSSWEEIKEVFQHWNLSQDSYFTKLDSKNYDPEILAKALDLVKSLSEKSK